jgi:hypothetical protein
MKRIVLIEPLAPQEPGSSDYHAAVAWLQTDLGLSPAEG